jgi:hypothetical protein
MTTKQITDHEELAQAWCAMWNDEPARARQLVTSDFRMWLGGSANGDAVRGPVELEGFVARFAENWSLVADHRSPLEPGPAGPAVPAADLTRAGQGWVPLWNGQTASAAGLVSGEFRIWFADSGSAAGDLRGPGDLTGYVARHRDRLPGLTFAGHRDLIVDSARQRAALTWTATRPPAPHPVGGLDLFQFTGGQVDRVWSWTGQRPFTF